MDQLLFCVNHPEKIAKRHCKKCDQNVCNECVFDSHIEHNTEIEKIEYSIDTKQMKISQILAKDIESIINKNLNDLKPILNKIVLEKTEQYIKDHKNLQLKLNVTKNKKPVTTNAGTTVKNNLNQKAKMSEGQEQSDSQKSNNDNNPSNKKVVKENNILARARLFAQKK
jgi:hypothetical protein